MYSPKTWFDNYKLGPFTLNNRILMAPLTRMRCNKQTGIANDLLAKYYKQRASFGMIMLTRQFLSRVNFSKLINQTIRSPGIYTKEQTEGWKKVINEVHSEGGLICLQIWHCGRAMPEVIHLQTIISTFFKGILPEDMQCWGPSEIKARDMDMITNQYYQIPHAMTKQEIDQVKNEFRQGAENAKTAGFDMIMLHAGNGYLIDQFLKDQTNKRTDEYGGTIANRCRFALEILDELITVFGKDRTGIRISPIDRFNDMFDSDPYALFKYFVQQINEKGIAFLEIKETSGAKSWDCKSQSEECLYAEGAEKMIDCCRAPKPFFKGTIINNERLVIIIIFHYCTSLDKETGLQKIQEGICDLISFGTLAISNPDLPFRFKNNCELAYAHPKYFFEGGEKGYIDYPVCEVVEKQQF